MRRFSGRVAVLLSLVVVIAGIWAVRPRSRFLAQIGHKTKPRRYIICPDWSQRLWLNDREQIMMGLAQVNIAQPGMKARIKLVSQCWRIDPISGDAVRDRRINARIVNEQKRGFTMSLDSWQPSPDGKWIACVPGDYSGPSYHTAMTVDGARLVRWPRRDNRSPRERLLWSPASTSWVALSDGDGAEWEARKLDFISPGRVMRIKPTGQGTDQVLGITTNDKLLVASGIDTHDAGFASGEPVKLTEIDLLDPRAARPAHPVTVGVGDAVDCISLSCQGDRLAWLIQMKRRSNPSFLDRTLALLGRHEVDRLSLWVSRTDGSDLREVGRLDVAGVAIGSGALNWAPDGKRVSFWENDNLWVIPVD